MMSNMITTIIYKFSNPPLADTEPEDGLLTGRWSKGWCYICPNMGNCYIFPDLGSGSRITSRLPDYNPARHLGRVPGGSVAWNLGRLLSNTLPFSGTANKGWSLIPALRLLWLSHKTGAREKPVNCHYSLGHHFFTLVGLYPRRIN